MITQEILIDVNNRIAEEVVSRLGESNVRQLLIKPVFYNPDGTYTQIVIDSENVHGMFRMVKPDGTFVTTNMSLATPSSDPAVFVVTLTGAMSQVAGRGYYDVRIGDTEDASEFIYSAQGLFTIDDDMLTDEMIESVAEANGMIFPDDFLTRDTLEEALEDYATKEYVADAIENIDIKTIYSENESEVGVWLDGVSPVYQKVIKINSMISGSYQEIFHGIDNVSVIWIHESFAYKDYGTDKVSYPIAPYKNGVSSEEYVGSISLHKFVYRLGSDLGGATGYVVARYTKSV